MITIEIPVKTLTVNHIYGFKGFRKFIKKKGKEQREFIVKCIESLINVELFYLKGSKLSVTIRIYEDWLTKKGEVKRKDLDNRCKFLLDSIFLALNIDDKYVFHLVMIKCQSKVEKAIVVIEVLN